MFILKRFRSSSEENRSRFYKVGFHGDQYLLQVVKQVAEDCKFFVETGANLGSTVTYVAKEYPHLVCFSCEPDLTAFQQAAHHTRELKNVTLYNETSQQFLSHLQQDHPEIFQANTVFWLDAHGYGFEWPLPFEIEFITTNFSGGYIFIDDFKVPGIESFVFHAYDHQECSFEYIQSRINPTRPYRLYYPSYNTRTSTHHPLVGWGLIEFGNVSGLKLSGSLADVVKLAQETPVTPAAIGSSRPFNQRQ